MGECFIDEDNELNLKLDVSYYDAKNSEFPNAIVLDSGQPWRYDDDTPVIKVKAGVIIEK